MKVEKSRAVGEMLVMRGSTQTCKIKIGAPVSIRLPETMDVSVKSVDTFIITRVTHEVDQQGHYSNNFEGIISGIESIPMEKPKIPTAHPQIATVKDNADSKGRIKVEFQWQKKLGKTTNWIRVQSPDAGKSEKVSTNRGLVTIPEIGDTVMVGFEYGDSSRPFSMGSIFTSKAGGGGGQGNKSKSLVSRSGNALKLDDETGSARLNDKAGSDSFIELDGSENIVISSKNTITLICGESVISMDKTGKINIEGVEINVSGASQVNIVSGGEGGPASGIQITPDTISMGAEAEINMGGKATVISIGSESGAINIVSAGADVILGGSTVRIN